MYWNERKVPKYREYEAHSVAFAVRLDVVGRRCAEGRGFVASAIFGRVRPSSGLDSSTGCRTRGGRSVDLTSTSIRTDSTLLFPCPSIYPSNTPHSTGFRLHDLSFLFFLRSVNRSSRATTGPCEIVRTYFKFQPFHSATWEGDVNGTYTAKWKADRVWKITVSFSCPIISWRLTFLAIQ